MLHKSVTFQLSLMPHNKSRISVAVHGYIKRHISVSAGTT